jgi:hypothetical protein
MLIIGGVAHVPLTQGKEALIDATDVQLIAGHSWYAVGGKGKWYATTSTGKGKAQRQVRMAWVLMGEKHIDHINGDGLDNRRSNLRPASQSQNSKNRGKKVAPSSSSYKGIWWHKRTGKWEAGIMANGVRKHLGYFDDPAQAAKVYDAAAIQLHGPFAKTNFSNAFAGL